MSLLALAAAAGAWGLAFWLPGGAPDLVRVAAVILAAGLTLLMPVGAMRDIAGESTGGGVVGRGVALLFVGVHVLGWLLAWGRLSEAADEFLMDERGRLSDAAILAFSPIVEWAPTAFAALAAASSLILVLAALSWIWRRR